MLSDTATMQKRESASAQPERLRSGRMFVPAVDIVEQADCLMVLADMPGVSVENLDVHYERGQLTIHGPVTPRQDPQNTHFLWREYGVGDFCRTFQVGDGLDAEKIEAELHDGVLRLTLPKTPELMPRKINVKTS